MKKQAADGLAFNFQTLETSCARRGITGRMPVPRSMGVPPMNPGYSWAGINSLRSLSYIATNKRSPWLSTRS
jgi:hypothetical protein